MVYTRKRRTRGPNKPKVTIIVEDTVTGEVAQAEGHEPSEPAKRRRRADVGGLHLRLSCPTREGYQRRWFNDTPGRLAIADELAYEHVRESGIKSDSPDSRVRRLVGTQAGGAPLYAYLMECPQSEYLAGQAEKEEQHRAVDDAINRGEDPTGRVQNAYGEGSIGTR